MIVTLTMNPSLDQTVELSLPLAPGEVQRAASSHIQAAGKGVNVARAIDQAGQEVLAVLPGAANDKLVQSLAADQLPYRAVSIEQALRTNITITDPDGTTTKINEPGPQLDEPTIKRITETVLDLSAGAAWLVLAGSLPPGVSPDFYATLCAAVRGEYGARAPQIAVDTSGAPLTRLFAFDTAHLPDLIKPNAEELTELVAQDSAVGFEQSPGEAAQAANYLVQRGIGAVLATLGAQGAVLVTGQGAWHATHAPVTTRSTVGAGDSALAGYLISDVRGQSAPQRLAHAVAYGSAAVALPGSTIPSPDHLAGDAVNVTGLF
ncbi:1-phosphofructokinase family hexose kinase [Glutamicibacter sp. MNS18]|uniref:1-phosphofructokinase family hexose kinase n=1 Tax=Glutamicibacter sp. MNS18 TaxID=2989817 RepID=UPI002236ACBF|nr:1-phosphofructokinase family hexose kinase [Glutamicibacter sp. MNS18]MCW4465970.1 1-phosphofructokinase family hexose kinase [Glutamicibacter sp. MNS18]